MKKTTKTLLALMIMSSILTGCASTTTSVKKSNSTLFKIGDTAITKQKVYDVVKMNNGATYTTDEVKKIIEKAEIKNENNINSKVEQLYKDYVGYYGTEEDFLKQLTNNGYDTPEEFKKTQLKPQAYENMLMEKYTTKNQKKYAILKSITYFDIFTKQNYLTLSMYEPSLVSTLIFSPLFTKSGTLIT